MSSSSDEYNRALDGLYSMTTSLKATRVPRDQPSPHVGLMKAALERLGITQEALERLRIVHVTGTKGKGSTCAFAESILRTSGLRTGLYTSPHLVTERERIRVCGHAVSEAEFAAAFFHVRERAGDLCDKLGYFPVLTLMALHIFAEVEHVDVAVLEVGIGGRTDCTNIVDRPAVCAVASIGIDHTDVLGSTARDIAWEKAGIFRRGVPAVCAANEPQDALEELRARAAEIGVSSLSIAALDSIPAGALLGMHGDFQRVNAALAVAACRTWWKENGNRSSTEECDDEDKEKKKKEEEGWIRAGLLSCRFAGRGQTVKTEWGLLHVDGAHTPESLYECGKWLAQTAHSRYAVVFASKADRDGAVLVKNLCAGLCCCRDGCGGGKDGIGLEKVFLVQMTPVKQYCPIAVLAEAWKAEAPEAEVSVVPGGPCAAVAALSKGGYSEVLVTGSLYLVGDFLKLLNVDTTL